MRSQQAILSKLDAGALRGLRPERARTALDEVPRLTAELSALERELSCATEDAEGQLRAAARHLVGSGGKRIRPMLTLLSCGACGGDLASAIPFACAVELTHSATLLHDDVIDDGTMRRGQPASRVIWGNAVSVLSGDWLLTRALELIAAEPSRSAALPAFLATMRTLVEGEVLQLSLRGHFSAKEEEYVDVIRGKTASLFAWGASAGAWAAGARAPIAQALGRFGEGIGVAFQLVDDALDYASDPAVLGKRLGVDLLEGRATLPLIRACEKEPALRERLILVAQGKATPASIASEVREAVDRTGGIEAARELAREQTHSALSALEGVPDGPYRRALREAAVSLTQRVA
jgi:octaprenyl-diphosphate synthase